ncbi:MAG TPA: shikimate kinase [Candidatus Limnocylindria bacterium]|jgi:shikimate kinase|nr:shikimate kinase [Candidatus Limnocylindria bacterium]
MGCGKSVVGVLVAQRAGATFHDLDFVIENEAGMSISDIFATKGEAAFRAMESRLLPSLLEPGTVVALGGGAPVDEANWRLIVERSTTVFLDCGFETIWGRIKGSTNRPLFASQSRAQLEALLKQRRPRYLEAVHTVDADRPADVVAEEVLSLWSG